MQPARFDLLGPIRDVDVIASGRGVRVRKALQRKYGTAYWRKMKGVASVRDQNGNTYQAEIHWYEAHGVGRVDWKIKRPI